MDTLRNIASKPLSSSSSSSSSSMPSFSAEQEFKYEKGSCALEYWEPIRLLKEGSISDIHLVRRRTKRIHVRYKKKREIMKFAKQHALSALEEDESDLYVLKSIMKDHVDDDLALEEMRSEIQTMSKLNHPNIARLYEAYERRRHIYLVMEYLPGGDLTDRNFTEEEAAQVIRKILSAVAYMHAKGVVHRDLKLENIMIAGDGEVKIIDFGLATKYLNEEHTVMTDRVGTLYSMSPQVLQGRYDYKCDLWSLGVVAYMLLSGGINPFWGPPRRMPWSERRKVMIDRIMRGQYQRMTGPRWERISPAAKEFVTTLLQMDPDDRPTAEEALRSKWIQQMGYSNNPLPDRQATVEGQKTRRILFHFKQVAIQALAQNLSEEEIQHLRNELEQCDSTGNGRITLASFKRVLETKTDIPKATLESLFGEAVDPNATISYNDFIIFVLAFRDRNIEEDVAEALDGLDVDGTRMVDKEQLRKALEDILPMEILVKVCDEAEPNREGKVSTVKVLEMLDKMLMKDTRHSLRSTGSEEVADDLIDEKTTAIPGGRPIDQPKYVYDATSKSVRKMEYTA